MKRFPFTLIGLAVLLLLVVQGAFAAGGQAPDSGKVDGREVLTISTIRTYVKDPFPKEPMPYELEIEKRFGLKFEFTDIISGAYNDKIKLMFATGEYPEYFDGLRSDFVKQFALAGLIQPLNDHFDKIPNYFAQWGPGEWDIVYKMFQLADGKLYGLPSKSKLLTGKGWVYRKGTFDRWGLPFPRTTDELYQTMQTIKQKDPEAIPMPNRWGMPNMLSGLVMAWRTRYVAPMQSGWYEDPDLGDRLVWAGDSNKIREVAKYANKLYEEGMIDKEFMTATKQQWIERIALGQAYIMFSYSGMGPDFSEHVKGVDPEANWTHPEDFHFITAYSDRAAFYVRYQLWGQWDDCFTDKCSQEKMDRILEWINWGYTEEGATLASFGREGIEYNIVNGKKVLTELGMDENGKPKMFALLSATNTEEFRRMREGDVYYDLGEVVEKMEYAKAIPFRFTEDEENELADLDTVLQDTFDEWLAKFIIGVEDPYSDATWDEYLAAVNKAGLPRAKEIRQQAYDRIE